MYLGPVSAGYPGKYVSYAIVAFAVAHLSFGVTLSLRHRRERRNREILGIREKPDARRNPMAGIWIALLDLFIIIVLISAVYQHKPN